jgi:hypothetical protein
MVLSKNLSAFLTDFGTTEYNFINSLTQGNLQQIVSIPAGLLAVTFVMSAK